MDLKANCLICRDSVKNYENQGPHAPWIEDTTMSLCQILNLDKYFQQVLENAVYCDSCLGTVRDMDFTLKNISALQKRLENSRFRVSTLLEINYDEVSSGGPDIILGLSDTEGNEVENQSYEHVVTSIWEALSADMKPILTESNINGSAEITMRSRRMIPHRHKIILHEPKGLSDSDSDFYPDIEPEVSIPTVTSRRTKSRKHSKPIKLVTKTLAQREKDLKTRQKKSKEFKCNSAKFKFSSSDTVKYTEHLKKHEDKSKVSMSPASIRLNLKQRKQKNAKFKLHMHKHSETKQFICKVDGCDKAFTWASSLRSHNLMHHTGDKKFKGRLENCTNVSSFKQKDHEETHSDCRSYFGDRYAKSFKGKKALKQHFKCMHDEGSTTVREMRRKLSGEAVSTRSSYQKSKIVYGC